MANFETDANRLLSALESAGAEVTLRQLLDTTGALRRAECSFGDPRPSMSHGDLVEAAIRTPSILEQVYNNNKITAIKELRALTGCDLKAAKDAILDLRVAPAARRAHDPYALTDDAP